MRKIFFLIPLVLIQFIGIAQTCNQINEDMENGGTSNYPTSWNCPGVYVGNVGTSVYSGTYYLGMNTANDTVQLPVQSCPDDICFYWRESSSTSNFVLEVQWSNDDAATWNTVYTISTADSSYDMSTYRRACVDLPNSSFASASDVYIQFVMTARSGGSFYLDDVCVSSGTCVAATFDNFTFSNYPQGCVTKDNPFSIQVNAYKYFRRFRFKLHWSSYDF